MFTRLDDILYPNKVEVIYFEDKGKYIYPIFKNGSSSIKETQQQQGYMSLINDQIKRVANIDVFLRNPKERYQSGFQTYVQNNSELDYQTIFQLGQQGIILDRHYLPQVNWLLNLMRYMDPGSTIHIHHLDMLDHYTIGERLTPTKSTVEAPTSPWIEMALRLDWILWNDMSGQAWSPQQILTKLVQDDALTYSTVFKSKVVANVLP